MIARSSVSLDAVSTQASVSVTTYESHSQQREVYDATTSPISELEFEIDEQQEEHFEPTVPTSFKFEQRKHDRHLAKAEYLRSMKRSNNHFGKRSKFRKLGRKKIRRS